MRFTQAREAGVWKYIDIKPGLIASSVMFYTPENTTSQGTVQIVVELHTGQDKSVFYSEAMILADHAGKWNEITFFEEMPAQINGRDIKNILINVQVKNATDAIVYIDDIGVYQIENDVNDLIEIIQYYIQEQKLTSTQAEPMIQLLEEAELKHEQKDIESYLSLLAQFLAEVNRLYLDGVLVEKELEEEVYTLINQYITFSLPNPSFKATHSGEFEIPVILSNKHSEDLSIELSAITTSHDLASSEMDDLIIEFDNPILIPANESIELEGVLVITDGLPEDDYYLEVHLNVSNQPLLIEPVQIIYNRNIINNSSFEEVENSVAVGWHGEANGWATGALSVSSEESYSNDNSLKLTSESGAMARQTIDITGGATYNLSAWLKSDVTAPNSSTLIKIEFRKTTGPGTSVAVKGEGSEVISERYYVEEDWKETQMQFTVPEEADLALIFLRIVGSGTAYFDDVVLKKVEIPQVTNLLMNPGFEEVENSVAVGWHGEANGWATGALSVSSEESYSNDNSLKLTSESGAMARQTIDITGGATYNLSAWLKSDVTAPNSSTLIKIEFRKTTGPGTSVAVKGEGSEVISERYYIEEDWKETQMHFTVPEEADLALIFLRVVGSGTAYFDDVQLVIVE